MAADWDGPVATTAADRSTKPVETQAHQHYMHGRRGDRQDAGDMRRTELAASTQRFNAPFELPAGSYGGSGVVGSSAPRDLSSRDPEPGPPPVGRRSRGPDLRRDVCQSSLLDPFNQQSACVDQAASDEHYGAQEPPRVGWKW